MTRRMLLIKNYAVLTYTSPFCAAPGMFPAFVIILFPKSTELLSQLSSWIAAALGILLL